MDKINRHSHVSQSEDEYIKPVSVSWILVCILSKNIRKEMIDTAVKFTQKSIHVAFLNWSPNQYN